MKLDIENGFREEVVSPSEGFASLAVTDFERIDIAVMLRIYTLLQRINPNGNKAIEAWLKKPPEQAIVLGEFDTPKAFLAELAKEKDKFLSIQLPVVYVTRDPSIAFADPSMTGHTEMSDADIIQDGQGRAVARVMASVSTLSFTVNFVGWHDRDISPLATVFMMWLRDRKSPKDIIIKERLIGCDIPVVGKFSDGLMATAVNSSLPFAEDRIRMLSVTVTVEADLLMAEMLETQIARYEFSTEVVNA